ncbi:MAG: alpha/beta hydrolase [Gemmatimonadales bacterium]
MRPKSLSVAAAVALLLIADTVIPAVAQPAPGTLETIDSVFVSQAGDTVAAQYGFLWVRENRSEQNDRMIRLGFVRFPSTSNDPGPPIVYLAGGPGSSGIDAARGSRFPLFMALREAGDVIALAQRGTRGSIPYLSCPDPWVYPLEQALTRETFLLTMTEWARICADYWRGLGIDLTAYNTVESADDVEDLRQALGAEQVSLLGISYGTHLALSVIRRHPAAVNRAVLAGVEGPDQTLKLPSGPQAVLVRVDSLVRADSAAAARYPDFLGSVTAVLDSLERAAVTLEGRDPTTGAPVPLTIGKFDVQWLTAGSIGNSQILSQLPSIYERLGAGDYASIAPFVASSRSRSMLAMTFAMDCASGASAERLDRIRREAEETLLGDAVDFPQPYICDAWPHAAPDEALWTPVRSGIPVQFISGTLDGRTPVSNVDEVRQGFRNSGHLVLKGAAHSDDLLLSTRRIPEIVLSFLRGGPAVDEVAVVPFRILVPE